MKEQFSFILLLSLFSFSSCIFDTSSKDLVNGYELSWIDARENQSIYKGEEQVPGLIYAVGYNSEFIVAKQHPLKGDFYSEPDYSLTNIFFIDIKVNENGDKQGVIGPLTEKEFDRRTDELGIRDKIQFTIVE